MTSRKKDTPRLLNKPSRSIAVVVLAVGLVFGGATVVVRAVSCGSVSECNSKIDNLNEKNSKNQSSLDSLQSEADTYQGSINKLQKQISDVQKSISANEAEQTILQNKIADYQKKIDKQKSILASDIKAMYVDGGMTSIEMLASSRDLSSYVDKQAYRSSVQDRLQQTLSKISDLKSQLESKKDKIDKLVAVQKNQRAQLAADKSQQDKLLNYNKSQQDSYSTKLSENKSKIIKLQNERADAISRITGSHGQSAVGSPIRYKNFWSSGSTCGGGYGYCWASFDQRVYNPAWGSGLAHECVNFVSDWLERHDFVGPRNPGNANMWPSYGQNVSASSVRKGDVAYMPLAGVGHVGVVTRVNGDGTFHISQMNWPVGGYYSEMDLYPQNITFVRFRHR